MATSGSTDWTLNRDQVITGALRKLAVLPSGGTPTAAQIADCADALNAIVKAFQADGMPLWKIVSTLFPVEDGQSKYDIGVGQDVAVTGKPLRVLQAFYQPAGNFPRTPMNIYNKYDFNLLPNDSTGTPVSLYYQPLRDHGVIHLWPAPTNDVDFVLIVYQTQFEDMDAATDNFDFPSEWIQALIYNLAWSMAPEYGIPPTDRKILQEEARYWHDYVLSMGSEEGSMYLQPNWAGYYK